MPRKGIGNIYTLVISTLTKMLKYALLFTCQQPIKSEELSILTGKNRDYALAAVKRSVRLKNTHTVKIAGNFSEITKMKKL